MYWKDCRNHISQLLMILFFGGMANVTFQSAMYHGDVVRVMILFYLLPVWSVLGGRFFLKEKLDAVRLLTMVSAVLGALLILGVGKIWERPPDWIDLMALISGISFSLNNIVFRYSQEVPVVTKVFAMFFGTSILISLYLVFLFSGESNLHLFTTGYACLYGVAGVLTITYGTQWGVNHLPAGKASIIIVMELVVAVISSLLLLGEYLNLIETLGLFMVIGAAILEGFRAEN